MPSLMGIYRAFVRRGLIEPKASRRRLATYKRWERGGPMELWQTDVVRGLLVADGTDCKVLTGIDDHSRFLDRIRFATHPRRLVIGPAPSSSRCEGFP